VNYVVHRHTLRMRHAHENAIEEAELRQRRLYAVVARDEVRSDDLAKVGHTVFDTVGRPT